MLPGSSLLQLQAQQVSCTEAGKLGPPRAPDSAVVDQFNFIYTTR